MKTTEANINNPLNVEPSKMHELDALIGEFLTDGVISPRERDVILKRAETIGIDVDEADLYIDAQLQKIRRAARAEAKRKRGNVCPHCNAAIPLLTDKCPYCEEPITTGMMAELQSVIGNLEDALVMLKSGQDITQAKALVERYSRQAKIYFENNPKVKRLLEEIAVETKLAEKQAKRRAVFGGIWSFVSNHKKLVIFLILVLVSIIMYPDEESLLTQSEKRERARIEASEQVAELSDEIDDLLEDGKLQRAIRELEKITIPDVGGTSYVVEIYDAIFLKVIRECIEADEIDDAEILALTYRSKIANDLSWVDSACYVYLKSQYASMERDFSVLVSDYDY